MKFLEMLVSVPEWGTKLQGMLVRLLIACALGAALWGHGFYMGDRHGSAKLNAYVAKQATEASVIATKQGAITTKVITKYLTKTVPHTKIVTQTIQKEVVRYVQTNPTSACLNARWRVLHDAAATNQVPPAEPGAPAGVPAAQDAAGHGSAYRSASSADGQ